MNRISVLITTYGDEDWRALAWSRAYPSVIDQGADEVLVRHWPGLTIGPARNKTASEARGDFLIHLDADDELDAGYVDVMRRALAELPDPAMTLFYPTVRYMRKGRPQPDLMRPVGDLRHDNFMVIGTMVSRKLFERVGGFNDLPHGFEDYSLWAKAWRAGARAHPVANAVYVAHVNPQSKHRTMWRNRRAQVYWHQRVQHELFPEDFPIAPTPPPGLVSA